MNLEEFRAHINSTGRQDPLWLEMIKWQHTCCEHTSDGMQLKPEYSHLGGKTLVDVFYELVYSQVFKTVLVDNQSIQMLVLDFPGMFCAALWLFSEINDVPIGESAPIVLGLMIGCPGNQIG